MDVKKILYGTGVAGAMTGAFLAGSIVLQPVFAQNTQTPPATTQPNAPAAQATNGETADGPGGQPEVAGQAEKPEVAGQAEKPEVAGQAEKPEAVEPNEAAQAAALQAQAKISLDQAKQTALGQFPGGTVQATSLSGENGTVVYEIDVVDTSNVHHDVKVDGITGAIAPAQAGNDGAGEGAD